MASHQTAGDFPRNSLGDELERAIRQPASRDGTSLNRAAVKLMRRGAGLAEGQDAECRRLVAGLPDRDLELRGGGRGRRGATPFRVHRLGHVGMRVLMDSSAYSQLMRGREQVRRIVRDAEEVLLSAVVLGELLHGFRHGPRYERNVRQMRAFLDNPYVSLVPVGATTSDRYSRIRATLRARRRPLPANVVSIAAHAMETGADLVSADRRLKHVDGIACVRLKRESGQNWPMV